MGERTWMDELAWAIILEVTYQEKRDRRGWGWRSSRYVHYLLMTQPILKQSAIKIEGVT